MRRHLAATPNFLLFCSIGAGRSAAHRLLLLPLLLLLLQSAAALEGMGDNEVESVLSRRAQASLAVERVTGALASGVESDLCDPPCDAAALERADRAIAERLAKALEAFYAAARARVTVVVNSR
jgi:hypothetical protein